MPRTPLSAALRLFVAAAVVSGALLAKAVEAVEPVRLRVLSYNIHHGEGTDGKLDLERIAGVIRSVSPDVVALQEVDRDTARTGRIDQPAELARLTEMKAIFERNIPYQGGEYGNAVLTRLRTKEHKNHLLPSHHQGEQRGALAVELQVGPENQTVLFIATHFDYRPPEGERLASAKLVNELARRRPELPTILAGDLNALPDSRTLSELAPAWKRANADVLPTFPAADPQRQIDYILVHPAARWKVIETRVLDEPSASDHRPIFAVLELTGGD